MATKLFGLMLIFILICSIYLSAQTPVTTTATALSDSTATITPFRLQPNHYTRQLPFFCREEWKFERKTKLPLRFRLGSVQYVDRLEGKLH
ncbi:MAG: hypothetical protein GTN67_04605 [Hydrotalea flava]|uniref:hypothetical protein n=1 Tax=Hydrotalea TaxID=1004300 RepID=UPI0009457552|nr:MULTISPECIES: hypothetical protein [Hydrotalea]MBY0348060.1 hypothetical protein [Hydrotalea flava]NIM34722.1 hypothetical protein [Hydrotalea flava]NIM37558.1 hypothetical protein [Hydrotalea flava]NIN02718.1 hypothetical protein [Hydrotalea flava]NIN14403.1 hypothetical protein [Hydrotalea flava]